jgi:hypothetical protein
MLGALGGLREMLRAQGGEGGDVSRKASAANAPPRALGAGPIDPSNT